MSDDNILDPKAAAQELQRAALQGQIQTTATIAELARADGAGEVAGALDQMAAALRLIDGSGTEALGMARVLGTLMEHAGLFVDVLRGSINDLERPYAIAMLPVSKDAGRALLRLCEEQPHLLPLVTVMVPNGVEGTS